MLELVRYCITMIWKEILCYALLNNCSTNSSNTASYSFSVTLRMELTLQRPYKVSGLSHLEIKTEVDLISRVKVKSG